MSRQRQIVAPSEILDAMSGKKTSFSEYYPDTNQIIIRDVTLTEGFEIDNITCEANVSFVDCYIRGYIHIRGGTFNDFSINGGLITYPLFVYGGTFNGDFELKEVDALQMEYKGFDSVSLQGGEFKGNIRIVKGAFQSITIYSKVLRNVLIRTSISSSFNHELEPYIKQLTVMSKEIDVLDMQDFRVGHLLLGGVFERGFYNFGNLRLNRLEFRYFVNQGRVRFDNITLTKDKNLWTKTNEEPSLSFTDSLLGTTQFSRMDFAQFASVEITGSTFLDVESSDTRWFSSAQLENLSDEAKRDLFRELKHAMIQQGNRVDELNFHALEMDAYRRSLSFKTDFWDLIILYIGKYTNNFATNYILPAIWIMAVALLVFLCSLWAEGLSPKNEWGGIFVVLNPAHPIDYLVPKDKMSNAFLAVDSAGRILIAILIYQLITPFRKFARG